MVILRVLRITNQVKKVAFRDPIASNHSPNGKLEHFLKKQREFVEKRKRSI